MYFLGINPEDDLPHPSLLTKFRKHKLEGNLTIDEIIVEINKQGVEKGILKASGISIDTTHSEANTFKCTEERVMKRLAKKIFKTAEEECGEVPKEINQDIPDYKEIEGHKEAKATMKAYLEETISNVEEHLRTRKHPKNQENIRKCERKYCRTLNSLNKRDSLYCRPGRQGRTEK